MNKINPRKKPCTGADIKKARVEAIEKTIKMTSAIYLTVLVDKFGMEEQISDIYTAINKLSESIREGYVSFNDLVNVLREEYGIEL